MASNYRRPGTFVEEVLLPQQIQALGLDVSVGAFAGRAERGPVSTPTFVSSWTEFSRLFGGFKDSSGNPYWLAYAVYQFFGNGGRGCYVDRVAASDSTSAMITLNDGTATPQDILMVTASSPGDWAIASPNGSGIAVQVQDTTPRTNISTYRVDNGVATMTTTIPHGLSAGDVVNVGGISTTGLYGEVAVTGVTSTTFTFATAASNVGDTTPTGAYVAASSEVFSLSVFFNGVTNGYLVEKFNDISLNPASDRYAISVVNPASKYVVLSRPSGFVAPTTGSKSVYRSPATSSIPLGLSKPYSVTNLSSVSVTSAIVSGAGVATLTASGHALQANDVVTVTGVNITSPNTGLPGSASLNGTYTVTGVSGSTSFSFSKVIQSSLNCKISLTTGGVVGTSSNHAFRVSDQITIAGTSDANFDTTARTLTAVTQSATSVAVTGSSVGGASNAITVASGDIGKFWVGQPVTAVRSAGTSALNSNSFVSTATTTTVNVSSIAFSTPTVTYTTAAAHNLFVGAQVVVASTTNAANSGSFTVLTVPTSTTFTISNTSGVAQASAAGTVSSYAVTLNASAIIDATVGSVATVTLAPAMQFGTTLTSPSSFAALSAATATYTLALQNGLSGSVTGVRTTVNTSGTLEGSGITKTDLINAADDFDTIGNNLIYNFPDAAALSSADCRAVYAAVIAVADSRGDSFVVVDTPALLDSTSAQSFAADITPKSNNAAIYYPWVNIADPVSSGTPATRKVPPGGSVVGLILQTDASRGVFKAPAGLGASLNNVISMERQFSSSDLDALNTALTPVNVIRQVPGAGFCVMGARNVGADRRMKYVSTRRTMLQAKKRLADLTAFAVFEPNDDRLWEQVRNICGTYLRELWQQGGLKGATQDEAYFVKCDAANNTVTSLADGELNIEVGVALQTPAEFVIIRIGQFDGATSINVQ